MSFWSKRIKNNKSIAQALNVSEDKIKALKNNELTIGGNTMNRTLKAIEEEKINKLIKDNEIWKWIQKTDFKKKREEFGYNTQLELAKLIGIDSSTLSRLETNKQAYQKLTPALVKVYEFYNNDFNKKIKEIYKSNMTRENINKDNKHIWKWYKNTDIRTLRISLGYKTLYDLVPLIGVSQSCLSDLELKHFKRINKTIINAYNFYNNNETTIEENNDDEIFEWYKSIEDLREYRRKFGYSLNKFMSELSLSYDQARTFERHEYKSATPIVKRIYDFYHNTKNKLPEIKWEPNENNVFTTKQHNELPTKQEVNATDNKELELKIEYLEKLNAKYEKIIDKLIERL